MDRQLRIEVHRRYPLASIYHGNHCPAMADGACDCGADEEAAALTAARDNFIAGWNAAIQSSAKA